MLRRSDGESVHRRRRRPLHLAAVLAAEQRLVTTAGRRDGRTIPATTVDLALVEMAANGVELNPGQAGLVRAMATSGARVQLAIAPAGPSKWLAWLKPGYPFQVAIDEVGKSFPARVQRIGARVDPVSQSVKLTATIDGKFPELIAGMSGRVTMTPPN